MSLLQVLGLPRRRERLSVPRELSFTAVMPADRSTVCEPPQWFVELAARKKGVQLERGALGQSAWVCELCGLASDPGTQAMAECLGCHHDAIHHGGAWTAQVMPAAEAVRLAEAARLAGGEGR